MVGWFALPGKRVEWRSTRRGGLYSHSRRGAGAAGKRSRALDLISSARFAEVPRLSTSPRCSVSLLPSMSCWPAAACARRVDEKRVLDNVLAAARNDGVKLINRAPAVRMDITASN